MIGFYRGVLLVGGLLAAIGAIPAPAQENLDAGKTPAQLYAADCAICHKTPQGLSKGAGVFGLSGFLREHYTASREAAAAIAAYVQAVDKPPPAAVKRPPGKRTAKGDSKGDDKAKPGETKPEQIKSGEPKASEPKSDDAKTGRGKPSDGKPSEAKAIDAKAAEPKTGESKPNETKSGEAKAEPKTEAKPEKKTEDKPAAKDEKKSDQ